MIQAESAPTVKRAILIAALAGVGACTIIVRPDLGGDTPLPIPIPLQCVPTSQAPKIHVLISTRVERSTVNLAGTYRFFLENVGRGLAGAGLEATHAVLLRADERPRTQNVLGAWGCSLADPTQLGFDDVIRYYAQRGPDRETPLGCVTDALTEAGQDLTDLLTAYPSGLPGPSGRRIFSTPPDLLLVIHLDALARRTALDEAPCATATPLAEVTPNGAAAWLRYGDQGLPPERVVHWFVRTEEGIDRATFVAECRRNDGLPADALDAMEPSARAVYGPLEARLQRGGGHAASVSMCKMISGDVVFLLSEIRTLAAILGVDASEDRILDFIQNGIPTPEQPPGLGG